MIDKALASELTPQQERFVAEYVGGKSAAAAARVAGYGGAYAKKAAGNLLGNPDIAAAVEAARADLRARTKYSLERLVAEILDDIELCKAQKNPAMMAVKGLRELLGKLTGLVVDRQKIEIETVDILGAIAAARSRLHSGHYPGQIIDVTPATPATAIFKE